MNPPQPADYLVHAWRNSIDRRTWCGFMTDEQMEQDGFTSMWPEATCPHCQKAGPSHIRFRYVYDPGLPTKDPEGAFW